MTHQHGKTKLTEFESARDVRGPFYSYFDLKLERKNTSFAHCSFCVLQIMLQQFLYIKALAKAQNEIKLFMHIGTHIFSPATTFGIVLCLCQEFLICLPCSLMATNSFTVSDCCIYTSCKQTALEQFRYDADQL